MAPPSIDRKVLCVYRRRPPSRQSSYSGLNPSVQYSSDVCMPGLKAAVLILWMLSPCLDRSEWVLVFFFSLSFVWFLYHLFWYLIWNVCFLYRGGFFFVCVRGGGRGYGWLFFTVLFSLPYLISAFSREFTDSSCPHMHLYTQSKAKYSRNTAVIPTQTAPPPYIFTLTYTPVLVHNTEEEVSLNSK